MRKRYADYTEEQRERYRATARKNYHAKREEKIAQQRERREKNLEAARQRTRAWYAANKDTDWYRQRQENRKQRRKADPAHRQRLLEQSRQNWAKNSASWPSLQQRYVARPYEPLPNAYHGHELFDQARSVVGAPWYGPKLYDADKEDVLSEYVLAALEGRNPHDAARAYLARRKAVARVEASYPDEWLG